MLRYREVSYGRCAHCGEPLAFNAAGAVVAWRVGDQFVCNEFCADGISDEFVATDGDARLGRPQATGFLQSSIPSLTK